mmetsp:Transcript_10530/g.23546  ORF Transcript_10530/g.23546 Transcript_10530/m.23546 type:complete len:241 (+) Transcript_10530:306-1028(+)
MLVVRAAWLALNVGPPVPLQLGGVVPGPGSHINTRHGLLALRFDRPCFLLVRLLILHDVLEIIRLPVAEFLVGFRSVVLSRGPNVLIGVARPQKPIIVLNDRLHRCGTSNLLPKPTLLESLHYVLQREETTFMHVVTRLELKDVERQERADNPLHMQLELRRRKVESSHHIRQNLFWLDTSFQVLSHPAVSFHQSQSFCFKLFLYHFQQLQPLCRLVAQEPPVRDVVLRGNGIEMNRAHC